MTQRSVKPLSLIALSALSLAACAASPTVAPTPHDRTKIIYDTDMGIDDWAALLLLGNHSDVELLAVTANGAGETRCEPAMRNIPALLDLTAAGPVMIACGDDYPMDGFFAFPEPWR